MDIVVVLLTATLVVVIALPTAVGAAVLARLDGASYLTALARGVTAFATAVALAAALTGAFAVFFT